MTLLTFTQNMLRLSSSMGLSQAFFKFLDIAVAMNSDHDDSCFIRNLLVDFNKRDSYIFMEAYSALLLEITGDGSGLNDILGEYMLRHIGSSVIITNQRIYDMLPGLFRFDGSSFRVADYDCHTGRRLLAAAKFKRNLRFYGTDSNIVFVRIALLNLCLNGLFGEIAFYNAQHDIFTSVWGVDLNYKGKPVIRRLLPEKSLLFQKRDGSLPDTTRLIFNF